MSSFEGMDVETVSGLIPQLRGQAQLLQTIMAHTDGLVSEIHGQWRGPASGRFLSEWQSVHRPQIGRTQSSIAGLADSLTHNLSDQQGASSASGASGAVTGGGALSEAFWSALDNPIFGGALGIGSLGLLFQTLAKEGKLAETLKDAKWLTGPAADFAKKLGPLAVVGGAIDLVEFAKSVADGNVGGATWHGVNLGADIAIVAAPDNPVGWCITAFVAGVGIGELIDHETGFSDHTSDMVINDRIQGYGGTMTPAQADDLVHRYSGVKGPFYAASDTAGSAVHKVIGWFTK